MNILMLGPWLPTMRRPIGNERMHQFARHLAKDHCLTLACATDHPNPIGALSALREHFDDLEFAVIPNRWKRLWSVAHLATGSSAEVAYFSSAALRTRIRDRFRSNAFDLVYVTSTSMIPYALDLVPAVPVILDFGDLDSEWWLERSHRFSGLKARVYEAEAARLRSVEITGARAATHCLVATPRIATLVTAFAPSAAVTVIAEGVDADEQASPSRPGAPHTIAFSPCLERDPEARAAAEFCDEILPRVRTRVRGTKLLVGCTARFPFAKRLAHLPGVEVVAPTSNLRALLRRATVAVAPRRFGPATQRGLLEAMAAGVPIITSAEGQDGLRLQHGREVYVEGSPIGFTERLIELLQKPTLREAMGAKGRAFIRLHYSSTTAAGRLSQVVAAAVNRGVQNGSATHGRDGGACA
jgi:glycosyltransferase involved in cell wall biosynthesis